MTHHAPDSRQRLDIDGRPRPGELTARYATVCLDLEDDHKGSRDAPTEEAAVARKHLHHFNVVDDETIVLLYTIHGDLEQARAAFDSAPGVLQYDVVGRCDGDGIAYVHCGLGEPLKAFLATLHEFEVVVDMPVEFIDGGLVRVTLVGEAPVLGDALDAIADVVDVTLEKTGDYHVGMREFGAALTDRQQQVLSVAVDEGYYEVPRRATLEDVAAAIDLSRATVGEHLQKIEAMVLTRVAR